MNPPQGHFAKNTPPNLTGLIKHPYTNPVVSTPTIRRFTVILLLSLSPAVRAAAPPPAVPVWEIRFGLIDPPVVAQQDITVRAPVSNQSPDPKPLECSGLAWFDGALLITSDRHGHLLFSCPIDLETLTIGVPRPHVVVRNEQNLLDDAECLALRPRPDAAPRLYVFCSLSNAPEALPLPKRNHRLRFTLKQLDPWTANRPAVIDAGLIRETLNRHFQTGGVKPYYTFNTNFASPDKNTYRWGNLEGITFIPDTPHLLCGLRNPLYRDAALLFVIRDVDELFAAPTTNLSPLIDIFTLDLGRRGVSDLAWDPLTKGYLIAAAQSNGPKLTKDQPFPPNTLDSALFWWSGRKNDPPHLFAQVPDMKIEALCRLGTSRYIAICSDEGDVSEGRPERQQSVLTIIDFTGF